MLFLQRAIARPILTHQSSSNAYLPPLQHCRTVQCMLHVVHCTIPTLPLCHMLRTPISSRCLSNSTRRNGLVRTSAVINTVGKYYNRNNFFPNKSRTMWYFTSMCLVRVLQASFLVILMQFWLSTLSSNAFTSLDT